MDYGPAIAAAFASNQAEETIAIRNAVLKCMENSPRHINWENYNIKANNGGSRMAGSENNNNFTSGRIQGKTLIISNAGKFFCKLLVLK